ncbi:MAG: hypothetical protein JSS15_08705 [Proteobacteria bacterium]|nr:hypothetical protein [Pseudomonadota bacterium]
MRKIVLALAGLMVAGTALPGAAEAQGWRNDGYYGKHDRWRGDRGRHRGWDRNRGWHRGPRFRTVCEWRGRYRPHRVCYRVRAW